MIPKMANADRKQPSFIQIPVYSASFFAMHGKIPFQLSLSKDLWDFGIFRSCQKSWYKESHTMKNLPFYKGLHSPRH